MDKIVQGNTSNIIFLKSTDDSMLDTLQKMSGITHKVYSNNKTVTRDISKLFMKNEGEIAYQMSAQEVPVISYNDMAFIGPRNSIVFRAGDSPIWNRNETILPMSWRLFKNTIKHEGKDYTLQTVPTLSTAIDFDVRKNQPDFIKMFEKRKKQAVYSKMAQELYKREHGYTDSDIERLDPDVYSDEIMEIIQEMINEYSSTKVTRAADTPDELFEDEDAMFEEEAAKTREQVVENTDFNNEARKLENHRSELAKVKYTSHITRADLYDDSGKGISRKIVGQLEKAMTNLEADFKQDPLFNVRGHKFYIGDKFMFAYGEVSHTLNTIKNQSDSSNVYGAEDMDLSDITTDITIDNNFIMYLRSLDDWEGIANGELLKALNELESQ